MPIVWSAYILGGLAISWVLARLPERPQRLLAAVLAAAVGTMVVIDSADWPGSGLGDDATTYLRAFDMASLPKNAVICTKWPEIPPLFYDQIVLTGRNDIRLIPAHDTHWLRFIRSIKDRPVFVTRNSAPIRDALVLTPCRTLKLAADPHTGGVKETSTLLWRVDGWADAAGGKGP